MLQSGCNIVKYLVKRCRVKFYSDVKSLLGLIFSFSCPIKKNLRWIYMSNNLENFRKIKKSLDGKLKQILKNLSHYTLCIVSVSLYDLYIYYTLCTVFKIIIYSTGFVWLVLSSNFKHYTSCIATVRNVQIKEINTKLAGLSALFRSMLSGV